ncbi:MAG: hypothetical protein ACKO6N_09575 [Myxococcota bacterium]
MQDVLRSKHAVLEQKFQEFQEALVGLSLHEALVALGHWHELLAAHVAWEEAGLLAAYVHLVPQPPRGGAHTIFFDEHQKLLRLADEMLARLSHILEGEADIRKTATLELLERTFKLKGVSEHHHQREEQLMIPALSEVMAADELAQLLEGPS